MPIRAPSAEPAPAEGEANASLLILSTVALTFVSYFCIGLPLAVLPVYVHATLGYAAVLAGLAVSAQYIATVLSRAQVGHMTDSLGPKRTVLWGFGCNIVAGALTLAAAGLHNRPAASLTLLMAGRLALGAGESMIGTGAIAWAIGRVGGRYAVRVMSWNGLATYGALAFGAPAGEALVALGGFRATGAATIALCLGGLLLAARKRPAFMVKAAEAKRRQGAWTIFRAVLPYGAVLGLGSTGFGVIAAFVTLFYADRHWPGAAFAVSLFGVAFVAARLVLPKPIARFGPLRVALGSLAIESVGLILIFLASSPWQALAGAMLTGFGFSPVFPSLGVPAMNRAAPESQGMALGFFSMFLDIGLGFAGPVAGILIGRFGYAAPFALGAAAAVAGMATIWRLSVQPPVAWRR